MTTRSSRMQEKDEELYNLVGQLKNNSMEMRNALHKDST